MLDFAGVDVNNMMICVVDEFSHHGRADKACTAGNKEFKNWDSHSVLNKKSLGTLPPGRGAYYSATTSGNDQFFVRVLLSHPDRDTQSGCVLVAVILNDQ